MDSTHSKRRKKNTGSENSSQNEIENNKNFFKVMNNKPKVQNDKNSVSSQNESNKDASSNTGHNRNESNNVSIVQSENDANIDAKIRSGFMRKVYGILLIQFLFTFAFVLICQTKNIKNFLFTHPILLFILMSISGFIFLVSFIIFMCKPDLMKNVPQNYIVLILITLCETVLLCNISILYSFIYVLGAISFVIAICVAIFGISLCNKINMKFCGMSIIIFIVFGLTYGLLVLIFKRYFLNFLFCSIGDFVFALFIIYDTQLIRDDYDIDEYIYAALTLYFDIIRLFIQLLKMIGRSKGGSN